VTVEQWALAMSEDSATGASTRAKLIRAIERAPFDGIFFETRGVTFKDAKTKPFSFVLVDSPALSRFGQRGSDSKTFSKQFRLSGEREGVVFDNLGWDARLVAPRPVRKHETHQYSHLAKFVRTAPREQVDRIFAMVAREYIQQLLKKSPNPVWLNTSGLGVAWLHFRLDLTPKYYQHEPFTTPFGRQSQ
jgi:hypothetical protein